MTEETPQPQPLKPIFQKYLEFAFKQSLFESIKQFDEFRGFVDRVDGKKASIEDVKYAKNLFEMILGRSMDDCKIMCSVFIEFEKQMNNSSKKKI